MTRLQKLLATAGLGSRRSVEEWIRAGRVTIGGRLPKPGSGRWITVGRLDVNTSGVLLFTTDGELAHRLMHPSSAIEREYLVRVRGRPPPQVIRQLLEGVQLDDGPARFDRLTQEK